MLAHARHEKIISLLEKHRKIDVQSLLNILSVSPATLRRDLAVLDRKDLIVRVHGGVFHPGAVTSEPSFGQKTAMSVRSKRLIAEALAPTIPQRATVFIDSGTTCLEAGRLLRGREDLTIITNSLPLIATHEQFRARLLVLGGEMRSVSGALVGDLALSALGRLRADVALIGASGLHFHDGAGTTELLETAVKREWISRSHRTVLLADASKWSRTTLVSFAGWEDFDEFYTDKKPPLPFRRSGLKIIYP
ncbi:MAG: DeoR/GlpR family DNA-binding transcription regulator [Verrucomicrobia bacterium]|nr:DeoR/GlpR family DNA-binding transcription regulator [Verrucomicrobiota bacterium]